MQDDLVARAERAILESQLARNNAREDMVNARTLGVRVGTTLQLVRAEGARSVSLCRESKSQAVTTLEQRTKQAHAETERNRRNLAHKPDKRQAELEGFAAVDHNVTQSPLRPAFVFKISSLFSE